ncbi:superoxide dismutase [Patescibacteria group bacterium]|nr:superoxide dismutase [Patescibacteria group bacterium]
MQNPNISNGVTEFKTPDLQYPYNALEPYIDEETMKIHHDKHQVAYTTNFNKALESHPELFAKSAEEILRDLASVPDDIKMAVKNHGGGHVHHSLFWEIMGPVEQNGQLEGELLEIIDETFGSFDEFKTQFEQAAMTVFGAGWAWLSLDENKKLIIEKTSNQDSPLSLGHTPIMGIDVWEHSYYLKYQNRRLEFVQNFWQVINWKAVSKKYSENK